MTGETEADGLHRLDHLTIDAGADEIDAAGSHHTATDEDKYEVHEISDPSLNEDSTNGLNTESCSDEEAKRIANLEKEMKAASDELEALPYGDSATPEKTVRLAGCMHDYHQAIGTTTSDEYLRALKLASTARELCAEDDFDRCAAMYIQMLISESLHRITHDISYLHMAEDFGRDSVKFYEENGYNQYGMAYSGRCEVLSRVMKKKFNEEHLTKDLNNALVWQGNCVDSTDQEDYGEDGEIILYARYKLWATLWVRLMDYKKDLKIDSLITQITDRLPCSLDMENNRMVAHNYWQIRLGMFCRKWSRTKAPEDLETIMTEARDYLIFEQDPPCSCHSNEDDPEYSTDPTNAHDVIRRAAGFFDEWFQLDNVNFEWYDHLATVETSIALWQEAYDNIPRKTKRDILMDHHIVFKLHERLHQKYAITKVPRDGWDADSKEWEDAVLSTIKMAARDFEPDQSILPLLKNQNCSFGQSCVTKENYSVFGVVDMRKPWDLDTQRLKFIAKGEDSFAEECWIKSRSNDGTFLLAKPKRGRDDDVLEFIRHKQKSTAKEALPAEKVQQRPPARS